jgi:Cdc6-like AAA superfamily ATPase
MIVGRTGTGKTVTWRTLQRALIHLNKEGKAGFIAVRVSA